MEIMKGAMKKMFGGNPKESKSMARIVNKHHFLRLKSLLEDLLVKASIVYGGSMDEDSLYIEPTILLDPPAKSAIMADEIFGPLLPIMTMKNMEDSIDFINSRPKSLAIYAFTNDESLRKKMISQTSLGSLIFNDAIIQYAADTLPFGGSRGERDGQVPRQVLVRHIQPPEGRAPEKLTGRHLVPVPPLERLQDAALPGYLPLRLSPPPPPPPHHPRTQAVQIKGHRPLIKMAIYNQESKI
ncbi:hypothetical protein SAY87_015672 [Trapa incisa]|uniref:Aldehyde dehydrogenase domain-containing protein n=1 Tax=Trapa incisa TaxID=236973 RepID=A0AAN7QWS6_9MYRT|nr:hypothetical protein SAY87_015672 [Trapa incisa]